MKYSFLLLLALCAAYGNHVAICTTTETSSDGGSNVSQPGPSGSGTGAENPGSPQAGSHSVSSESEQGVGESTNLPSAVSEAQSSAEPNSPQEGQAANQDGNGTDSEDSSASTAQGGVSPAPPGSPSGQAGATQLQAIPKKAEVKSALLKNFTGVKVTGPCDTEVGLYLIPYIYISVKVAADTIELSTKFPNSDNIIVAFTDGGKTMVNKCEGDFQKTFKFIAYLEDNILTLKWIVYPQGTNENNKVADVRKYKLPNLERPITSIQVHSLMLQGDSVIYTSKDYSIKNDIPKTCQQVLSACFLSGNTDIENCYTCNLLINKEDTNDKCFDYVSADFKNEFQEVKAKGQDDEESNEYKLAQAIDAVLSGIYKTHINGNKELITSEELHANVMEQISNYCHVLKEVDTSGTLEVHQMGNEIEVFNNLVNFLQKHGEEKYSTLEWKLQNPALCLKNVNDWLVNKKGLVLPLLPNGGSHIYLGDNNHVQDEQKCCPSTYQEGDDGIIDLSVVHKNAHAPSTPFTNHMFCNYDYCDRTKDTSSCLAKIETQDQGDCATSWLFASKIHLETIKCMKGYEHVPSSALYVANCSNNETPTDKCHAPSNPLEFLHTLEETKFLPTESNLPYSYKAVNNVCPQPKTHWQNLWENVTLLAPQYQPNAVSTKGYTAYQSANFNGNMDAFIKLVKSEIMNKGSVIAYVKATGALSYDLNGKKVQSLCGSEETPDLAVNIIGYGNYINGEGVKKSYWLLQNSWGKYWGDGGHFKVDMHGPEHCQHNFIHTAAVFNLDVPHFQSPAKDTQLYSYHLKSSPDFYKNLYYNALGGECGSAPCQAVHGQDTPKPVVEVGVEYLESAAEGEQNISQVSPVGSAVSDTQVQVTQQQQQQLQQHPPPPPPEEEHQNGVEHQAGGPEVQTVPGGENPNAGMEIEKIVQIIHVLKHIKQTKMVTRVVTYEGLYDLGDPSCSRTEASSVEKLDECIKFCNENYFRCKLTVSPGYCLTKLRNANDCNFCFV